MPEPDRRPDPAGLVLAGLIDRLEREVVGQRPLLERLVIALLAGGHVLIEGVPGLAKTRSVRALARALDLPFRRIQFTPDLLPADLTGTQVYRPATGTFDVRTGPIVASVVLADEINRAPAKVQSALLEAMQEGQVTVGDQTVDPARPVLGPRHPEPGRARGDLPPARGPARPVPDEAPRRLSRPGGRAGDARPGRRRPVGRRRARAPPLLGPAEVRALRAEAAVGPGGPGDQGIRRRPRPGHPRPGRLRARPRPADRAGGQPPGHAWRWWPRPGPTPCSPAATS